MKRYRVKNNFQAGLITIFILAIGVVFISSIIYGLVNYTDISESVISDVYIFLTRFGIVYIFFHSIMMVNSDSSKHKDKDIEKKLLDFYKFLELDMKVFTVLSFAIMFYSYVSQGNLFLFERFWMIAVFLSYLIAKMIENKQK